MDRDVFCALKSVVRNAANMNNDYWTGSHALNAKP